MKVVGEAVDVAEAVGVARQEQALETLDGEPAQAETKVGRVVVVALVGEAVKVPQNSWTLSGFWIICLKQLSRLQAFVAVATAVLDVEEGMSLGAAQV